MQQDLFTSRVRFDPSRPELAALLEPWLPAVVIAWGLGVLLVSARLLGGFLVVRSLTRRGTRPIESNWHETLARLSQRLALRTPVRLLESAHIQVPMVIGWWRPLILLPATVVTGIPSDQLALILGHELAHIKRYDYLVNLVQSVIEAIFFYHPAVWWISTRIREEREHCCDDAAVALCTDRLEYARALSALEHMRGNLDADTGGERGHTACPDSTNPRRDARGRLPGTGAGGNRDPDRDCLPRRGPVHRSRHNPGACGDRRAQGCHGHRRHIRGQARGRRRCVAGRWSLSATRRAGH